MVVIPKEKPVIQNLNSYYLDIKKLCEHYQGEIGSGGIHFRSPSTEGLILFDKDDILNAYYHDGSEEYLGDNAVESLIEFAIESNFIVTIHGIESQHIYFWANIPNAETIYQDLSTEFTDLEGLIKKMESEKLTGYIDVSIGQGDEGGILFFNNGVSMGGSYSWGSGDSQEDKNNQVLLIGKTKENGGVFQVNRIPLVSQSISAQSKESATDKATDLIQIMEEYLKHFEAVVNSHVKNVNNFSAMLKKKFVEKAEKYPFLDPFAAEFEFINQKIRFDSDASDQELGSGLLESINELADELGVLPQFTEALTPWKKQNAQLLKAQGLNF